MWRLWIFSENKKISYQGIKESVIIFHNITVFNQRNAALVSIRDFFQKHLTILIIPSFWSPVYLGYYTLMYLYNKLIIKFQFWVNYPFKKDSSICYGVATGQ